MSSKKQKIINNEVVSFRVKAYDFPKLFEFFCEIRSESLISVAHLNNE